jgi:hypothetical protein
MWELNKATKGDVCHFFNKHGYSKHVLENDVY